MTTQTELDDLFFTFHTGSGYTGGKSTTKKSYHPTLWGKHAWEFIDYVVLHYPTRPNRRDQLSMVNFMMSLGQILPCEKCRKNYNRFMREYPPLHNVSSRSDLQRWFDSYRKTH